jgi:hypothetical protein
MTASTWCVRVRHHPAKVKADRKIHRQTGATDDHMNRHRMKEWTVRVPKSLDHTKVTMDDYKIRHQSWETVRYTNPRRNYLGCSPDMKARDVGWNSFRDLGPMSIRAGLLHPTGAGRWLHLLARFAHSSAEQVSSADLKAAENSDYRRAARRKAGLDPYHQMTEAAHCSASSFAAPTVANSWVAN